MARNYGRNESGSLAALVVIGMVPVMIAIGAIAVDLMHYNDAFGELQRTCDAAALAGAIDLNEYAVQATDPWTGANVNKPIAVAKAVSGTNFADGRLVSPPNANVQVSVTAPSSTYPGDCTVSATMQIRSIFAQIFGNFGQTVTRHAKAAPSGSVSRVFATGVFPIALALNTIGPNGTALKDLRVGDAVQLGWHENVYWTGLTTGRMGANTIRHLIDSYLDPSQAAVARILKSSLDVIVMAEAALKIG